MKNERGEIKDIAEMVPEDAAVELALERTVVGQESMLDRSTVHTYLLRKKLHKTKNSPFMGLKTT